MSFLIPLIPGAFAYDKEATLDLYGNYETNETFINSKDYTGRPYHPKSGDFGQKSYDAERNTQPENKAVKLSELHATQPTVQRSKVNKLISGWDKSKYEPIKVNSYHGKQMISNGHHRVAAAISRGETHLPAHHWNLDKPKDSWL
jgi:hypothetical protein